MTKVTNYRDPKYLESYEDVYFQLHTALDNPGNGLHQRKTGHTFVVDNSGETNPFDWYHARFNVNFKLQLLANGGNVTAATRSGIVNSALSLIKKLNVMMSSVDVYDCQDATQATNIKNLLEYSKGYSESQGKNEFFYLDTIRNTGLVEYPNVNVRNAAGDGQIAVSGPKKNLLIMLWGMRKYR